MNLPNTIFAGAEISDKDLWTRLPEDYRRLLLETNGCVAFGGGLHLRGICGRPEWHSLQEVWNGQYALHKLFPVVRETDIPFGQDCLGDQFLLRDGIVHRLRGEVGELESVERPLVEFLRWIEDGETRILELEPLIQFQSEGGRLSPDQSLMAYPPFVFKESGQGVKLGAVSKLERILFLADLSKQLADVKDGETIEFKLAD